MILNIPERDEDLVEEALQIMLYTKQEAFKKCCEVLPAMKLTEHDFGIPNLKRLLEQFEDG